MVRKVRWSRSALLDLQNLFEYISESAPMNALRLAGRIHNASESLDEFPERGRVIPEFEDPSLREIFCQPIPNYVSSPANRDNHYSRYSYVQRFAEYVSAK